MTAATVAYHDGRPAINVKVHAAGLDFWPPTLAAGRDIGPTTAGEYVDAAYARVQSDFWQAAEQIATERGLGEIEQAGRSGGWLVFTSYDPTLGGTEDADPPEWLADYRAMTEWAEAFIADAPRKVRTLAEDMARDELGEPAARRMFATFRPVAA